MSTCFESRGTNRSREEKASLQMTRALTRLERAAGPWHWIGSRCTTVDRHGVAGTPGQVLDEDRNQQEQPRQHEDGTPENEGPTPTDLAREEGIARIQEIQAAVHFPASGQPTRKFLPDEIRG